MTFRRLLPGAARALCGAALVALLVYGVDWHSLPAQFSALHWPPAILAMLGLGLHFIVSPWKWRQSLLMHDLHFTLPYLIRTNGTGFFLNNFLPSGIGGDAYRVLRTLPGGDHRSRAISAVVIERLVGFAALMALGGVGALPLLDSAIARTFLLISVAGGVIAVTGLGAAYVGWMKPLTARIRHTRMFEAVSHNAGYLLRARYRWVTLIATSMLFQLIAIANVYFLFQSLGVDVPVAACALIGAVSGLATLIPISINGIGVVEGSFAGTAVALGIPFEPALAVAILIRLLVLPPSIVFGLLYVFKGDAAAAPVIAGERS